MSAPDTLLWPGLWQMRGDAGLGEQLPKHSEYAYSEGGWGISYGCEGSFLGHKHLPLSLHRAAWKPRGNYVHMVLAAVVNTCIL